jgi:hypothetical protein
MSGRGGDWGAAPCRRSMQGWLTTISWTGWWVGVGAGGGAAAMVVAAPGGGRANESGSCSGSECTVEEDTDTSSDGGDPPFRHPSWCPSPDSRSAGTRVAHRRARVRPAAGRWVTRGAACDTGKDGAAKGAGCAKRRVGAGLGGRLGLAFVDGGAGVLWWPPLTPLSPSGETIQRRTALVTGKGSGT